MPPTDKEVQQWATDANDDVERLMSLKEACPEQSDSIDIVLKRALERKGRHDRDLQNRSMGITEMD